MHVGWRQRLDATAGGSVQCRQEPIALAHWVPGHSARRRSPEHRGMIQEPTKDPKILDLAACGLDQRATRGGHHRGLKIPPAGLNRA